MPYGFVDETTRDIVSTGSTAAGPSLSGRGSLSGAVGPNARGYNNKSGRRHYQSRYDDPTVSYGPSRSSPVFIRPIRRACTNHRVTVVESYYYYYQDGAESRRRSCGPTAATVLRSERAVIIIIMTVRVCTEALKTLKSIMTIECTHRRSCTYIGVIITVRRHR